MERSADRSELKKFGIGLAVIIAALFGVLLPWLFSYSWPWWPWVTAGIVLFISFLAPAVLSPVQRGLLTIAEPLGRINSVILLSLVYFLLVCPMGFIMKVLGKDPIPKAFEPNVETYRKKSDPPTKLEVPF
ncbi:SxtJ family membrane protein [Marinobacter nauticus]|uniref:SxtJ family membrane protein n=1 Tax=Marinobacter nauticus TaxID=2743 RepID=UPI001CD68CBF|nr:SxtJ family membrane protein [Marinobacter nauticus]MCA0911862.1 SxtJ family membrane protein [Marinobacter nauticus]